ncbi:hypothetical protein GUJ93_ZPchr0010g10342 [Zizania palustris]|uniref:Uncharacterized protein n=1 Tax=Zizania palustris TaxID=103762 RepID=A0A8J5WH18_ZIZPA|nr:hypothetical protein GUJ93_ZPchr0010g10342 [Zizania palustris]
MLRIVPRRQPVVISTDTKIGCIRGSRRVSGRAKTARCRPIPGGTDVGRHGGGGREAGKRGGERRGGGGQEARRRQPGGGKRGGEARRKRRKP